jgi:flagellar hook-length control protein FliK
VQAQPQQPTPEAAKPADAQQATPLPAQPQAKPGAGTTGQNGQQNQPQPEAPRFQQPVGNAAVAAQNPNATVAPKPAAAPTTTTPTTVVAGTPGSQPVASERPAGQTGAVPLSRAAEAVENTIRIAAHKGITAARLNLKPAELGGVEIRLKHTADGLTATVIADTPEAAQALQQAGSDLRQKLEGQGIDLQHLDISYGGNQGGTGQAQGQNEPSHHGRTHRGGAHGHDGHGDADHGDEPHQQQTIELPDGVLVDVLA